MTTKQIIKKHNDLVIENLILKARVKVLEEMLGIATNAIEEHLNTTKPRKYYSEQEAIGTMKYGEMSD